MSTNGSEPPVLRVACAQLENVVGDIIGNAKQIRSAMEWAEGEEADVLVLPELALTGYPLEDLAMRKEFVDDALEALHELAAVSGSTATVVGTVDRVPPRRGWDTFERTTAIGAAVLCDGELRGVYHKVLLPTYDVFSEARTYAAGDQPGALWRIGGVVAGISICEDLWSGDGPPELQAATGAQILLVPNGSPYYRDKRHSRQETAAAVARRTGVPVIYVNCVGGVDDLVFDGGSIIADAGGEIRYLGPQFETAHFVLDVPVAAPRPITGPVRTVHARVQPARAAGPPPEPAPVYELHDEIWHVLALGVRDFARCNGFERAILGLSGGIDAAVTATVAFDALGAENVIAVAMPAPGEDDEELLAAREVAESLGVQLEERPLYHVSPGLEGAADQVAEVPEGYALEELNARARAATLRTMGQALGAMVLATGNKSELSVGAGVLGGDMTGDFAPLRDCPKTLLYDLVHWRNQCEGKEDLPDDVLDRTPSVRERDELTLPSYRILDEIVERIIEGAEGVEEIVAAGFERRTVQDVLRLIIGSERKRRMVSPGVKITARAWGKDLHMPVINGWRPFERDGAA
ncbi:MAG: NAD+ synthase [Actinomycetota bacterium]